MNRGADLQQDGKVGLGSQRRPVIGLALGATGAFAVSRLMSSLLFAVRPADPVTFGGVGLVLIAVAIVSCFVPARRVTTIDPVQALRTD